MGGDRWPIPVVVIGACLAVMAACSLEETLPAPDCVEGGSGLIVAQSVPTGGLVPCFDQLPAGWEFSTVMIDDEGTEVHLESDRAGGEAASLQYRTSCDPGEAVSVPSDQEGADAYEYIEQIEPSFRAERFYLFPGGCVRWRFHFNPEASAALSVELQNSLTLLSRDFLNDSFRETFVDEDL